MRKSPEAPVSSGLCVSQLRGCGLWRLPQGFCGASSSSSQSPAQPVNLLSKFWWKLIEEIILKKNGIPSSWPFEEWVKTHTFRLSLVDPWPCSHCWGQMASSLTTYKKCFILNQYLLHTEKSLSGKDIFSSISWFSPQPRVPFNQSTCYIQYYLHLKCHSFVHCLLFVLFSFCFCSQDKREYWRPLSKLNYESFRTT